jgi:hypothetical protein
MLVGKNGLGAVVVVVVKMSIFKVFRKEQTGEVVRAQFKHCFLFSRGEM